MADHRQQRLTGLGKTATVGVGGLAGTPGRSTGVEPDA